MQQWLIKLLGQKIKDTLAFNQSSCSEYLHLHALPSSRFSNNVHSTRINHQVQTYKADKQTTKNNAPIKRETLKEHTKGQARLDGSLKNTKCAWKRKAWLTLKRWLRKIEQGPERSYWDRAWLYRLRRRQNRWTELSLKLSWDYNHTTRDYAWHILIKKSCERIFQRNTLCYHLNKLHLIKKITINLIIFYL
jgi:hypothetical protein